MLDYDDIKNNYIPNGYATFYDSAAEGAWVFNPSTRILSSYDSPQVVLDKVNYVNQNDYAGVFFWELSGDREAELVKIISDNLD